MWLSEETIRQAHRAFVLVQFMKDVYGLPAETEVVFMPPAAIRIGTEVIDWTEYSRAADPVGTALAMWNNVRLMADLMEVDNDEAKAQSS